MHGKCFFMGWTNDRGLQSRTARVFNGIAWPKIVNESQSRAAGKQFSHTRALAELNKLRIRFPDIEEISVVPIAEWRPK